MTRGISLAGVILAAGESSRMGSDKALLPWPPIEAGGAPPVDTFLSAAIRSFAMTDFVLVVVGKNEGELAPIIYANGASLAVNPDPDRGQFSSLRIGLQEVLNRGRDAALIALIDRPPAMAATVSTLRNSFESAGNNVWAVIPEFEGKHGHPYIAGREMIEAFLQADPTSNAREIEHKFQAHVQYVPVNDPFAVMNINTPGDYAKLSI